MTAARDRAIAWTRRQQAQICDRVEPWEHGTALFVTSAPDYWTFNIVLLETSPSELGAAEVARAVEELQAELDHRKLVVEDEATGAALRPGLQALGWTAERLAVLSRPTSAATAAPPAAASPPDITTAPEPVAAIAPLRRVWLRADGMSEEDIEISIGLDALTAQVLPSTPLVAREQASGEPLAYVRVRVDGDGAEIEDAFCLAAHRGRGIGSALLLAAIAHAEAAGAREVFIVADDEGDARRLYERLGFRTAWRRYDFFRRPARS